MCLIPTDMVFTGDTHILPWLRKVITSTELFLFFSVIYAGMLQKFFGRKESPVEGIQRHFSASEFLLFLTLQAIKESILDIFIIKYS